MKCSVLKLYRGNTIQALSADSRGDADLSRMPKSCMTTMYGSQTKNWVQFCNKSADEKIDGALTMEKIGVNGMGKL